MYDTVINNSIPPLFEKEKHTLYPTLRKGDLLEGYSFIRDSKSYVCCLMS